MNWKFDKLTENLKNWVDPAKEKLGNLKETLEEKSDETAEKIAEKITQVTGRETSIEEVKKAAKRGAIAIAAIGAAAAIARIVQGGVGGSRAAANALNGLNTFRSSNSPSSNGGGFFPSMSAENQADQWHEEDLEYDRQQYDQLRDHNEDMDRMDDVIEDQISYNQSMDFNSYDF